MKTKICSSCKKDKALDEFNKKSSTKDGVQTICRKCNSDYLKKHYKDNKEYYYNKRNKLRKRNTDFIQRVRSLSKCSKCGEDHIACLDFHHLDSSTKKYHVAEMANGGVSIEAIKEEIRKCIVLCANCHRKEHYSS